MRASATSFYGMILSLAMATILAVVPAQGQIKQRTIEAKAGEDWHHAQTGVAMPAALGGFERQYIRDLTENGLDVFAQYHGDKGRTRVTLFFYRAAVDSVPLWFDAANQSLRRNVDFLPDSSEYLSSTFTPPGQSNASGMMAVYSTKGGDFKSSGVAMMPLNGWLVKIRFSSEELSPEEMAVLLEPMLNDIQWPEKIVSAPTAVPILSCAGKLKLADKVSRIKPTTTDAIIGGLTGALMTEESPEVEEEAVVYCRDPQDFGRLSIYRPDETRTGYLLPLGDAGRAASVSINDIGGLIGGSKGKRYTPILMRLDQNVIFPDLNKLPTPQTLMAATGDNAAISSVTTWPLSSGSNITINVSPDEDQ
ncbi:MAG: hypothetical protein ABJF89_04675 [Parasphingorhabdus sp.]|uniref:hypothetical protein n=1 Tax=Parasphingorhabdus sp. TaxID=2709688 RepID=UPI003265C039